MPPALLAPGPLGLAYWQLLALPALTFAALAAGRVAAYVSTRLGARLLGHRAWEGRLLARLKQPLTLGWALAIFDVALAPLDLPLRTETSVGRVAHALAWLTFFWALFRLVNVVGDEVGRGAWARARPSARSLTSVLTSLARFLVFAFALMAALSELGYPVTSVVAGLGLGGVALALAAQKTVENLFGSISILADQPFRVGDTVRIENTEGVVEEIGLRSTRLRTADKTLVVFPNGKLADMKIESLGPRSRTRFTAKLALSRTCTAAQIGAIIETLTEKLLAHAAVMTEDVSVRLVGIGDASFDLEIAAFVQTIDPAEFAKTREELLLTAIGVVESAGGALALPTRELIDRKKPS